LRRYFIVSTFNNYNGKACICQSLFR